MLIVIQPVYMLALKLALFVLSKTTRFKWLRTLVEAKYKSIKWNGIIEFYNENYLVLSMIGWINMKDLRFGHSYTRIENFNSALGVTLFAFSFVFPVLTALVLYCNFKPFF
jgi:hypothetical protein